MSALLPKEVGGGRLGISVYTYLCFRYKYSLPGSPGWRLGYKTDEVRVEDITKNFQIQSQMSIIEEYFGMVSVKHAAGGNLQGK